MRDRVCSFPGRSVCVCVGGLCVHVFQFIQFICGRRRSEVASGFVSFNVLVMQWTLRCQEECFFFQQSHCHQSHVYSLMLCEFTQDSEILKILVQSRLSPSCQTNQDCFTSWRVLVAYNLLQRSFVEKRGLMSCIFTNKGLLTSLYFISYLSYFLSWSQLRSHGHR